LYIAYRYRLYPTKDQSETIERRFIYARSIYKKLLTQAVTTDRRQKWPEIAAADIAATDEYASRSDEPKLEFRDHLPTPVESSLFYQHIRLYPLNKMICGNQKRFYFKTGTRAGAWDRSFNYQDAICFYPRSIYIGRIGLIKAGTAGMAGATRTAGIAEGRPIHASVVKTRTGQYYVSLLVRYEPSRPEEPR